MTPVLGLFCFSIARLSSRRRMYHHFHRHRPCWIRHRHLHHRCLRRRCPPRWQCRPTRTSRWTSGLRTTTCRRQHRRRQRYRHGQGADPGMVSRTLRYLLHHLLLQHRRHLLRHRHGEHAVDHANHQHQYHHQGQLIRTNRCSLAVHRLRNDLSRRHRHVRGHHQYRRRRGGWSPRHQRFR